MSADATFVRSDPGIGSRNRLRPAHDFSARRLSLALLLAAIDPVLLFGGGAMFLTARAARAAARDAAVRTVRHVAERVTGEIAGEVAIAETRASLPSLDGPDLGAFHRQATRIVPARALWDDVLLFDPSGKQLMSVVRASGERPGPPPDQATFEKTALSRTAAIGEISASLAKVGERIYIGVPVGRGDELRFVLMVELSLREIRTILQDAGTPDEWTGLILDASGNSLASTGDDKDARPFGNRSAKGDGVQIARGRFSVERKLPEVGDWSVHYSIPNAELDRPVTRSLLLLVSGALTSVVLAGGVASVVSQDLLQRRQAEYERAALRLLASEERCALAVEAADLGAWKLLPTRSPARRVFGEFWATTAPHSRAPFATASQASRASLSNSASWGRRLEPVGCGPGDGPRGDRAEKPILTAAWRIFCRGSARRRSGRSC